MLHSVFLQRPVGQILQRFVFLPREPLAIDVPSLRRAAFVGDEKHQIDFSAGQLPLNLVDAVLMFMRPPAPFPSRTGQVPRIGRCTFLTEFRGETYFTLVSQFRRFATKNKFPVPGNCRYRDSGNSVLRRCEKSTISTSRRFREGHRLWSDHTARIWMGRKCRYRP